jgi:hypothetical protein
LRPVGGQALIRPISARYMHATEIESYGARLPELTTDAPAEAFLDQDLSDLDFAQFRSAGFEFQPEARSSIGHAPAAVRRGQGTRQVGGYSYTR